MADALVGNIVATLSVDARAWQQGLQAASTQLAQFQQSVSRVPPALQQVQQGMAGIATATGQMSQQLQATTRATSAWSSALQVAGGIGLATSVGAMTSAIVAFGRETIQTGARLEQLRASLSAIAGSSAAGQQQFQFLTATAQRLGVALEPIARGWRTLTAAATQANLPLADQQRLLTALATEARRVGASNEELNRAIVAVSQSASKGKLSMEELRQQLGEALPTAFAAVARGMGRTTEELEKLIETGSVRFPAFARALTRGFEQMQAASGQMAETSQAAFNRLANAWTLLQDTIMKSGLNTYLVTVANNLREAVEWTTKLAAGRAGAMVGPSMQDLGATSQQQQEVDRLNRVLATLEARQGAGTPLMQETTRTQIQNTIELRDQILASMRATQDQAIEQGKVTAEVNKTNTAQQLQADYVADVTKKVAELRKAQEDFRKEAALAPERLGRPGTEEFLKGMAQVTRTQLDALTKLVAQPPQGVTIPDALRTQLAAEDIQLGRLGQQIEALRDKERVRRQAEREAAAQAERAISQEISLTAQLARVKAFGARPEESTSAERARQQVLQQGVEMQRIVDDAMRQFEQSPALRQRAPQLLDDFTQMQQGLQAAIDTQAMQAFNHAIKQDVIDPLERLAETYGMVKAARDVDKASTLEAAAANTVHAERAKELAAAIRDVAAIEAQLPELRRQAALSAPAVS